MKEFYGHQISLIQGKILTNKNDNQNFHDDY